MAHFVPTPVKSAARKQLDALLSDGQWHDVEDALQAIMPFIAPGKAARTAERERVASLVDGSIAGDGRSRGDEHTAVAAGKRRMARNVIHVAVRAGTIERDGDRVRLCPPPSDNNGHGSSPTP